jgi:hypothetical protein
LGFFKRFRKPKAQLTISIDKNECFLGDDLKGVLNVTSQEILDVEGISVRLKCVEEAKKIRRYQETVEVEDFDRYGNPRPREEVVWQEEEYWDSDILFSDIIQVSGQMTINTDFDQSYLFTLKLPSIGRETYHSIDHNLLWILNARMKTKKRKDVVSQNCEVIVCKTSEFVKEVVREVVLIPCKYCGGLMPQTAIFCPNCGARRKA